MSFVIGMWKLGLVITRKQDIYVSFDGENHKQISENDIVTVKLSGKALNIYSAKNMGQFAKVDKKLKSR